MTLDLWSLISIIIDGGSEGAWWGGDDKWCRRWWNRNQVWIWFNQILMTSNTEVRIWIAMMNHMWEWWWWILDRVAATALANVRSFALFSSSFSLDFFLLFSNNFVLKTKRKRWRWDLCLWYKIWCNNGIRAVVESGRFEKEQIMVSKKIIEDRI